MPQGEGTYGSQVGRPSKKKNSTDNYAQTKKVQVKIVQTI